MRSQELLDNSLQILQQRCGDFNPEIAVILGSGFGQLGEFLQNPTRISYADIPLLPQMRVEGHQSELLLGELFGFRVMLFCGRFHVYQGLTSLETTVPVQLAAGAGCRAILLSCAVGSVGRGIEPGDFFLVTDHLNFSGLSPLQGSSPPAFIDLHDCYRHDFFTSLKTVAAEFERNLHSGILAYMVGPSYETPAEIAALRSLGASAVSMSTIPEAIMARALGLEVAALALVTNMAGGSAQEVLSHQDVLACSAAASVPFSRLVSCLLNALSD